jgi:hypothetical protein
VTAPQYAGRHQATRRAVIPFAYGQLCHFCGRPMLPGQQLDLDHLPGTTLYRGPAHSSCNRADGARRGNRQRRQQRRWEMDRVGTGTLGVEVAENRQHTSIVSACRLEDGRVQVELVAYLPGTASAVDRIVEMCGRWKVLGVVVDPMGGATNLRQPLADQRVPVLEPTTADVKVAHADFLDLAHARRLHPVASAELSSAVQHLSERMLGGQPVFDRRGAPVDVSPAVAAELSVWGLQTAPAPRAPFFVR